MYVPTDSSRMKKNMDAKEIAEEVGGSIETGIKQEPLDLEPPDSSTKTMDESIIMMEVPITVKIEYLSGVEDDNPEHIISSDIKQEPKSSADLELLKGGGSTQVALTRSPTHTHTDIKQEPVDPDDVTTESIPEMEDIKYANTQGYLDIGETVSSDQDRSTNEQDRARPGTSSEQKKSGIERRKYKSGEKTFRCEICDRWLTSNKCLKRHMKSHTGEKPLKCEACDFRCIYHSELKKHMRTHTGEKPFKCDTCDYRCTESGSLNKHKRTHTGEKPFKCEACDFRFIEKGHLKTHMKTHTGEKPYKCKACDYRCAVGSSLKVHMRTHNGEKPYKCDDCDRLFKCNSDLKKHKRIHSGEKPFKCEACDYRCTRSDSLKKHMKMHTQPSDKQNNKSL